MAILLANIGTSDLAIRIKKIFLPIGFDRNEPGLDYSELSEDEKKIWNNREQFIAEYFCPKWGIPAEKNAAGRYLISFREITKKVLDVYENYQGDYEKLDKSVCPIRIFGVIKKAYDELGVKKAYLFVTDQEPEHRQDTIYLFKFIQLWIKNKLPDLELNAVVIPKDINPIQIDPLLNFYYNFLIQLREKIDENEGIFVSCKGGTPQMQNALNLQTTALGIPRLLFIDPDPTLLIKRTLQGQPPNCNLKSYWRYNRQQKYQTVEQLLTRYDFDGAINILEQWKQELEMLESHQLVELPMIQHSRQTVQDVIAIFKMADSCLNFDVEAARIHLASCSGSLTENDYQLLSNLIDGQKYETILNLYTQIMMYREFKQVSNVLTLLGSFYDVTLYRVIERTGGGQYLTRNEKLNLRKLQQDMGETLYQQYKNNLYQLSKNGKGKINTSSPMEQYIDIYLTHRQQNRQINEILEWNQTEIEVSEQVLKSRKNQVKGLQGLLNSLKYWVDQRHKLIHKGLGFSIDRVKELDLERTEKDCSYKAIPEILELILNHRLLQFKGYYRQDFVSTQKYYIYSAVREAAIASFKNDLRQ